jgi:hypothetical protein
MHRGLLLATLGAAAALVAVPVAYALLTQQPVKTTRFYEQLPAAATDGGVKYFAWTQNTRAHPRRNDAFLKRGSEPLVKLNTAGNGYLGGIDPPLVVYQQVVGGRSNLKIYNAALHTRTNPPAGVNTSDWEWEPSISGDWLLYGRQDAETDAQWILLRSLSSATEVILDEGFTWRQAGQVNGNYAVWTRCDFTCDVVRYDILGASEVTLPEPSATTYQYAAAVASTGVTYVGRSGKQCGSNARIVRYFGSGDPAQGTVVADLGAGRDMYSGFLRENSNGSIDLFYDRYRCSGGVGDIYRIYDPAPGP